MSRRLFNVVGAGAALAAVLAFPLILYFWADSYLPLTFRSIPGRVVLVGNNGLLSENSATVAGDWLLCQLQATSHVRLLGFEWMSAPESNVGPFIILAVPYWFLGLVALAIPVLWTVRHRRANARRRRNLCPTCGYDLRATPQAGGALLDRCPECGTPAQPQVKPKPAEEATA